MDLVDHLVVNKNTTTTTTTVKGDMSHFNAMGFLSLPEASLHYLHTFDTMRQFKYHI